MKDSSRPEDPAAKNVEITGRKKAQKVLNLPLLLGTLIAAAVLAPAAYAWRSYQVKRTCEAFSRRAVAEPVQWLREKVSPNELPKDALQQALTKALKEAPKHGLNPRISQQMLAPDEPGLAHDDRVELVEWLLRTILDGQLRGFTVKAQEEIDWRTTAMYWQHYSRLKPDDAKASWHIAMSYDLAAKTPEQAARTLARRIDLYHTAIGMASAGEASGSVSAYLPRTLRRRVARLLIGSGELALVYQRPVTGQFTQAEVQARKLLEADSDDGQARRLLAEALYGQLRSGALAGEHQGATCLLEALENALLAKANWGDVALSVTLARIYRDEEQLAGDELSAILSSIYESTDRPPRDKLVGIRARIVRVEKSPLPREFAEVLPDVDMQAFDGKVSTLLELVYGRESPVLREASRVVVRAVRELMADDVIDQMVAARPNNTEALLARYRYRIDHELPGAEDDLQAALELDRDNLAVLLTAAGHAQRKAERKQAEEPPSEAVARLYEEARTHYKRAIAVAPANARAYWGLGAVYLSQGRVDLAVQTWDRGLDACGRENTLLNSALAEALVKHGRVDTIRRFSETEQQELASLLAQPKWGLSGRGDLAKILADWLVGKQRQLPQPEQQELADLLARPAWGLTESKQRDLARALVEWLVAAEPESLKALDRALASRAVARNRPERLQRSQLQRTVNLFRGIWLVRKREYPRAITLLRQVTTSEAAPKLGAAKTYNAYLALATAYGALTQWDQAALTYEKAADLRPEFLAPRLASAAAWVSAGWPDPAIEQYERALALSDDAEIRFLLAKTRFLRQIGLPKTKREWGPFEKALGEIKKRERSERLSEAWRVAVLEAQYLVSRSPDTGTKERARQLLGEAEKSYPDSTGLLEAVVPLYDSLGYPKEADRALEKFEQLVKEPVDAYVLRSSLHARRKQYEVARKVLQQGLEKLPPENHPVIHVQLAQISLDAGQTAEAEEKLKSLLTLRKETPAKVSQLVRVAELALRTDKVADLEWCESKLREREGPDGSYWRYYRAQRLLAQAKSPDDLDEVEELQEQVKSRRPAWPAAHWLGGLILERRGRFKQAVEAYEEAMRLGERGPVLSQRLLAVNRKLARLLMQSDLKKATAVCRRICELAPESGPDQRRLALVLALRSLGKYDEEGEALWQEAQNLWEQVGSGDDASSLDQRLQAVLLYRRGGQENLKTARQLLEKLVASATDGNDYDRLALAEIHAAHATLLRAEGSETKAQEEMQAAREQYSILVNREKPNAFHLLLYIGFLIRSGQQDEVLRWRTRFEELAAGNAHLLASYIDLLLRHGLTEEVRASMDKLQSIAPHSLKAAGLRARWLRARGETSKVEPLVEAVAEKNLEAAETEEQRARVCSTVGAIYARVKQYQLAEHWFRRAAESIPERYDSLAVALARQGQMSEAIGICRQAAQRDSSPRPAIVLAQVLTSGRASGKDFELAEPILSAAIETHQSNAPLLFYVANVRLVQQRINDAVELYQRFLELRPKNVVVLNNLAAILAELPDRRAEAMRYIDQAIDFAPSQRHLLDTKGTLLLHEGKPHEALRWLQMAVAGPDPDPRFRFHLAVAYDRMGEDDKARHALEAALDDDLEQTILTRADREMLAELKAKQLVPGR